METMAVTVTPEQLAPSISSPVTGYASPSGPTMTTSF
jgi:hypothetical protein